MWVLRARPVLDSRQRSICSTHASECSKRSSSITADGSFAATRPPHATSGSVLRFDHPVGDPFELIKGIHGPGGLAFHADGRLIVGRGDRRNFATTCAGMG
jgi:hypothetical protein